MGKKLKVTELNAHVEMLAQVEMLFPGLEKAIIGFDSDIMKINKWRFDYWIWLYDGYKGSRTTKLKLQINLNRKGKSSEKLFKELTKILIFLNKNFSKDMDQTKRTSIEFGYCASFQIKSGWVYSEEDHRIGHPVVKSWELNPNPNPKK